MDILRERLVLEARVLNANAEVVRKNQDALQVPNQHRGLDLQDTCPDRFSGLQGLPKRLL
jgi:hypothetical protein